MENRWINSFQLYIHLWVFYIWEILNIKNDINSIIQKLLRIWYYKAISKRTFQNYSELVCMLFEGARCRTIGNVCSLCTRHIAVNCCLTGHLSSRLVGLLNIQDFKICFVYLSNVCLSCKVRYCQWFTFFCAIFTQKGSSMIFLKCRWNVEFPELCRQNLILI